MDKHPNISDVLKEVLHNPASTTDFLLGTICTKVSTIEARQLLSINDQDALKRDIQDLKDKNAFNKGFIAAITTIGATMGAAIVAFSKYIWGLILLPH